MRSPIEVFKFGGGAVGSAAAIRAAPNHVRAAGPLGGVVSAMNGVTDLLIESGKAALASDSAKSAAAARQFEQRHSALLPELFRKAKDRRPLDSLVAEAASEMREMTRSISVLHEFTTRA